MKVIYTKDFNIIVYNNVVQVSYTYIEKTDITDQEIFILLTINGNKGIYNKSLKIDSITQITILNEI